MIPQQLKAARSGAIRWHLLQIADVSRPQGIYTVQMTDVIRTVYPDVTELEIRRELDYLEERETVKIAKDPLERWYVELTRVGVEIVEYTIDCQPGISRPRVGG